MRRRVEACGAGLMPDDRARFEAIRAAKAVALEAEARRRLNEVATVPTAGVARYLHKDLQPRLFESAVRQPVYPRTGGMS